MCDCEPEFDFDDPDDLLNEEPIYYRRVCEVCGKVWWSLHCPHDGYQNPCAHCGVRNETISGETVS